MSEKIGCFQADAKIAVKSTKNSRPELLPWSTPELGVTHAGLSRPSTRDTQSFNRSEDRACEPIGMVFKLYYSVDLSS